MIIKNIFIKLNQNIKHFDYSIKITKTILKDTKEIDKRINLMKE